MIGLRDRVLNRSSFVALVEDLSRPPIAFNGQVLAGDGWAPILSMATPPERARLLAALEDVLLRASEGARKRLELWDDADTPRPTDARDEWISERLAYWGDESLLRITIDALSMLPDAVLWGILTSSTFVAVGRDNPAWTSSAWLLDTRGCLHERLVVLGPALSTELLLHEFAHVWHSRVSNIAQLPMPAVSTEGELALRHLARAEGWDDRITDFVRREERLADAQALSWLLRHQAPSLETVQ